MIGAHASFTIGPSTLESLVGAARDTHLPIHIHLAEDAADERDSIERYGVRVAERLSEAGALQDGDLVAHGVHLDEREIDIVDSSAAWIAHNPRSNMNNGVGRAPVEKMGPRVALGTDGIDGDLFAEAKACHFGATHAHAGLSPDRVVGWMTAGSTFAGSLWKDPLLGTLETGASADVVVLEYPAPTPFNSANLAGHLIFGIDATAVRDVIVGGRFVVRDRRHALVDEEDLAARCRVAARKLWTKMQDL
jgi:cytosine/adenosine deaminase-related metal-dependent hydrolase